VKEGTPQFWAAMGVLLALLVTLAPIPVHSTSTTVLITAVFYDSYPNGNPDKAFRLTNAGGGRFCAIAMQR